MGIADTGPNRSAAPQRGRHARGGGSSRVVIGAAHRETTFCRSVLDLSLQNVRFGAMSMCRSFITIRSLANVIELAGLTKVFGGTRAVDDHHAVDPRAGPSDGWHRDYRRPGRPRAQRSAAHRWGAAGRQTGPPEPVGAQSPALDRCDEPHPGRAGRRGARHGRVDLGGGQERGHAVAGHEPAARHRRRPAGAAVRRAGQRPRPGRHPLGPHTDAHARRPGPHGVRVQSPARRRWPTPPTGWL